MGREEALLQHVQELKEEIPAKFKALKNEIKSRIAHYQEVLVAQLVDVEKKITSTLQICKRPDIANIEDFEFTSKFDFDINRGIEQVIMGFTNDMERYLSVEYCKSPGAPKR
jgi:hypothetical protein